MSQPDNPMRGRLAVVATVIGLSAVITGPAWWRVGHQVQSTSYLSPLLTAASSSAEARSAGAHAPASASSPSEAVLGEPLCGTSIPVPVFAPSGYQGPKPGPARGASEPDLPGQLVAHWTGSAGDLEVRWPADAASSRVTAAVDGHEETLAIAHGDPGEDRLSGTMLLREQKIGCQTMRLTLYGRLPTGLAERIGVTATGEPGLDALAALVTDPAAPLVARRQRVTRAPTHAVACQDRSVPNRSGRAPRSRPKSDPRAALRAFLEPAGHAAPPIRAGRGYRELVDSAGRITYGKPFTDGKGYVALVRMVHRSGGWAVGRWEASGC